MRNIENGPNLCTCENIQMIRLYTLCRYYKYKQSDETETGLSFEQGDRGSNEYQASSFLAPLCLPRFTRPNMAQRDVKERHKRENLATSLVPAVALFNFSHATRRKRRWPASRFRWS